MNAKTNNVITFDFKSNSIRTIELEGEPWFVARDICKALDINVDRNTGKISTTYALRNLRSDEVSVYPIHTYEQGPVQSRHRTLKMKMVSESGMYKIIMRSDKPEAKVFQNWVTREVLPSIRKTGQYKLAENRPMPLPTSMADAMRKMAEMALKQAELLEEGERREAALAKTDAERIAALEEANAHLQAKLDAEQQVKRLTPMASVAENHFAKGTQVALTDFARGLMGLNTNAIKGDLERLGYLYKAKGKYRVRAEYRDVLFVEKRDYLYRQTINIFLTTDGQALISRLYDQHKLTLKKAYA